MGLAEFAAGVQLIARVADARAGRRADAILAGWRTVVVDMEFEERLSVGELGVDNVWFVDGVTVIFANVILCLNDTTKTNNLFLLISMI